MEAQKVSLPYVNNAKAILITLLINLAVAFLLSWPGGISYAGVLRDSAFCAATTVTIDLWIVYASMKKMRAAGQMPSPAPVSLFMQRLPQNPFALGVLFIIAFGVLTAGANALVLWFFDMKAMTFVPWMAYKLVYSTILSVKITEYAIFRYVQPDWASGAALHTEATPAMPVKNPLPKISVFKALYGSVTGNLAMNIIIGTALGGVVVNPDSAVIVYPTTVQGIPITGLVFGLISGVLVTNGVLSRANAIIRAASGTAETLPAPDKRFTWMPVKRIGMICIVCICLMPFSAAALWAVMTLLGLSIMNFFQFTVFITVYATIISKPLSHVLIRRCMQPDYIMHVLQSEKKA